MFDYHPFSVSDSVYSHNFLCVYMSNKDFYKLFTNGELNSLCYLYLKVKFVVFNVVDIYSFLREKYHYRPYVVLIIIWILAVGYSKQ